MSEKTFLNRVILCSEEEKTFSSYYTNVSYEEKTFLNRISFSNEEEKTFSSKIRMFEQETVESIFQDLTEQKDAPIEETEEETIYSSSVSSVRNAVYVSIDSYDLTDHVTSIQITRKKNDLETWTINLQDDMDCSLSPENFSSAFIDFYDDKWTIKKNMIIRVYQGSQLWTSSKLIITDYYYDSERATLMLSGTNKSKHLFCQNQNMDPWKYKKAKEIIKDILEEYKVSNYELNFDDFMVREFNMDQATPIDKIKDLLWVAMAHWYWKGDKFYAVRDKHTSTSGDWTYTDRVNILSVGYGQTLQDYYNEITIGRTDKLTTVCDIEGDQFGFNTQNLCAELRSPRATVIFAHSGTIEYITFFDESGNWEPYGWHPGTIPSIPINGTGIGSVGTRGLRGAATSMTFSYRQILTKGFSNLKGYKIRVSGFQADTTIPYEDPSKRKFSYHYVNKEEQKKYGVWKYPQVMDNPLIPDSDWAKKLCKWTIEQHSRTKERLNLTTPLNMWMYPGDTILVTDYRTGMTKDMYFVEDVTINITTSEMKNTIMGTKYKTSSIGGLWKS